MKKNVGLIGYGRFGKFLYRFLKKSFIVVAHDKNEMVAHEPGLKLVSLEEAARQEIIVLAVPINQIPKVLQGIAPHVKPGTIVCDVASVKEQPIKWMKQYLPPHTFIIGTHPLFGPDSVKTASRGQTMFLCPARVNSEILQTLQLNLKKMGLLVEIVSPEEHDKLMARTLFLTQFIGRGLIDLRLGVSAYTTQNFRNLMQIVKTAENDSTELFNDMYKYNRFAEEMPAQLSFGFQKLKTQLQRMNG